MIRDTRKYFDHEKEDYTEYDSNGGKNKTLSVEKYLNQLRPNLKDETSDIKKSDAFKIQLTMTVNFNSSKDNEDEGVMHSKSVNKEININEKAGKVIEKQ